MSSTSEPKILTFKASAAIAKGKAVKIGASNQYVTACSASTDKAIGVAQNAAAAAEDMVEVALPGGGGKALAQTTISAGDFLTPHTDGTLKPATGPTDRVIAMAMEDAVAADVLSTEVIAGFGPAVS